MLRRWRAAKKICRINKSRISPLQPKIFEVPGREHFENTTSVMEHEVEIETYQIWQSRIFPHVVGHTDKELHTLVDCSNYRVTCSRCIQ
jgi:hypothetical protein